MPPYRSFAGGSEQCSGVRVIDSSIRHGSDHPHGVFKADVAFGSHEGRKHAFGVLPAFEPGNVADNDTDDDLFVLFGSRIPDEPSDVVVSV